MSFSKALIIICSIGLLMGLGIHLGTFFGVVLPDQFSFVTFILHAGGIFAIGGFVLFINFGKGGKNREIMKKLTTQGFANSALFKIIMFVLMLYTVANFVMNVHGGSFHTENGKYVESYKGKIMRTFPNKATFEQAKRRTKLHQTRGFSGHWIWFYGGPLAMLLLFARREEEIEAELAREATAAAQEKTETVSQLEDSGDFVLSSDEILTMGERLWGYRPAKSLIIAMVFQIVVLSGILVFISQAVVFVTMGIVVCTLGLIANVLAFRSRLKHSITSVSFAAERCSIEYLDGNNKKRLELAYEDGDMLMEEENVKGGPLRYLQIKQDSKTIIKQLCDGPGAWTAARCEAIAQAWQDKAAG